MLMAGIEAIAVEAELPPGTVQNSILDGYRCRATVVLFLLDTDRLRITLQIERLQTCASALEGAGRIRFE